MALSALVTLAVLLSVLPVQLFAVVLPDLTGELQLSALQAGLIPSFIYVTAALVSLPIGSYVDRIGFGRPLFLHGAVSIVAVVLLATSHGSFTLIGFSLMGGFVLAAANPATNMLVAERVPALRRGAVVGWKQSGVPAAWMFTGVAVPLLVGAVGWRLAVLAAGALPILAFFAYLTARQEYRHRSRATPVSAPPTVAVGPPTEDGPNGGDRIGGLNPKVSFWYAFLMGAASSVVNVYLYTYAVTPVALSPATGGAILVVMGASGVAGKIAWGVRSGRSVRPAQVMQQLALFSLVAMTGLVLAEHLSRPVLSLALAAAAAGFSLFSWTSPLMVFTIADHRSATRGLGVQTARAMRPFFLGMIAAPPLFGLILDVADSFTVAWSAFAGCALLAVVLVTPAVIGERQAA